MKIMVHDLKELTSIDYTDDYRNYIHQVPDILSIDDAHIKGTARRIEDEIIFDLRIDVSLKLACSKTLKPVHYPMNFTAEIIFGNTEDADYPLTDSIELSDIIFGYIVSEKPYTIYHPDAHDTSFEEKKNPHPAFADLDKLLKK